MGICYTVILMDEFDWHYSGTNKVIRLNEFIKEIESAGGYCNLLASWNHGAVFDLHKTYIFNEEIKKIILKSCDSAYYMRDNECNLMRIE